MVGEAEKGTEEESGSVLAPVRILPERSGTTYLPAMSGRGRRSVAEESRSKITLRPFFGSRGRFGTS